MLNDAMENKIPNIIHFIFGLEKDCGNKPFSLVHFIAVRSAFLINRPVKIYLYYRYTPRGVWWERVTEFVELVQVSVPRQIFGKKLCCYAHKADVLRLMILYKYGGIYLDLDSICIKPFAGLLGYDCVMGKENNKGADAGLCNALIMTTRKNKFIGYWLHSYNFFRSKGRDKYWSEHSVGVPQRIAALNPELVHIEPQTSFFYPSYHREDLKLLFEDNCHLPNAYSVHLWETVSYERYLSTLSINSIIEKDTTYNILARPFINDI